MRPTLAFGDDRSEGADTCWQWIVSQRWDGWGLEVVTAEAPTDFHPVEPGEAELHPWDPDEPRRPVERGFVDIAHLRAEIDPRVALIAKSWDLLAIGARGEGLLKSLHLGSTADWLLREPTSPLMIARRTDPVTSVLLAADGSPHVRRATETLAKLPLADGASVRIIAVDDGHADTESALKEASATLSATGAKLEMIERSGRATHVIIDEIERTQPDLVVMGARGQGGFQRLVLGSTTSAVAGSTDCSLLVAHAEKDGSD